MNGWHYPSVANWWVSECHRQVFVLLQSAVCLSGFCPETLLEVMRKVQANFGYDVLNTTIFPHSSLTLSSCRCRRSQYAEHLPCERFFFWKALNHLHFLRLVSGLHKRGGWGTEGRNLQNRQIPHVYPHLRGKANKKNHCHPELDWKPWLLHQIVRRMLTPGECSTMSNKQMSQGDVCCSSTPAAVHCCAFLLSAPFLSSSRLLLPLLLGFSVRQESSWRVGKLVLESSVVMQVGQVFQVPTLIPWDNSSLCHFGKLQWWSLFCGG